MKIIQNHVVFYHLFYSAIMEVKYEIVCIALYFLFKAHASWNLSIFTMKGSIFDGYTIKSYNISAIIGFELFYIHEKSLEFIERDMLIFIKEERTIIDASFEHLIPSEIISCRINFIKNFNIFFRTNYIFLNLLWYLFHVLVSIRTDKFVNHCWIFFFLTLFKRNNTIIFPILWTQLSMHFFKHC